MADDASILNARDICVHFPLKADWPWWPRPVLRAVDGASLELTPGHTLGLVGESGCGKSTLARALTGMVPISSGTLHLGRRDLTAGTPRDWQMLRREVQMIFQDPLASLDPRMTVAQIVAEPLHHLRHDLSRAERRLKVAEMVDRVGLSRAQLGRYPHEFSGGQCQRIGIARALVVEPRVLICDEPVSALDVSIQAKIVELLAELQRETRVAMLFIAHDLAVVRQISHDVRVMYLGRVMEQASSDVLFDSPRHPYTKALLSAVPRPDLDAERARRRIRLPGDLPSPANPPSGCVFRTRCPWARPDCGDAVPELRMIHNSQVACHYAERLEKEETA
ncbi:MAG: ATP-binding cassette domain-containing protein [Salinisphaera sp.]|jgi:oligopeptide transport system ATP-binding protein|nr:ATP-binding cassette domain-containing protein [Salinisphaera sp.]